MIIAINDIKEIDKTTGKIFKQCSVYVRKGSPALDKKKVLLSELANIKISKDKNGIVCFCDGYKHLQPLQSGIYKIESVTTTDINIESAKFDGIEFKENDLVKIDLNPKSKDKVAVHQSGIVVLESGELIGVHALSDRLQNEVFQENKEEPYERNEYISLEEVVHRSQIQEYDKSEEDDKVYQADKLWWVLKYSKDKRLKLAVQEHYACDNEYVLERIEQDFPGFVVCDYSTYILAAKYPSYEALLVEKYFKNKLSENKKYKMRTRIGYLDIDNPIEIIVIFNYLNNFEIYCPVSMLTETCLNNLEHDLDE